ncbi:MAG: (2Fe-2S)-binding protein [Roseiflexaceae bacterium]|nr:(2Fe-2S)-binding protein [Roseiflexaceae bacterium]
MPQLTISGVGTVEVAEGTRLVRAIEQNGVDILHRCGGYSRCTTCQVSFAEGEPTRTTEAEYQKLADSKLQGTVRLSCQILCDHDMSVTAIMTVTSSGLSDAGPTPEPYITPEPVWREA